MSRVLRVLGLADGRSTRYAGMYLRDWRVDPRRPGIAMLTVTDDPATARVFPDVMSAIDYWRAVSPIYPVRPDGQPNRPLTAYAMEVI